MWSKYLPLLYDLLMAQSSKKYSPVRQMVDTAEPRDLVQLLEQMEVDSHDLGQLVDQMVDLRRQVSLQKQTIQTLERDAVTDALTGLLNRRGFERELQNALARTRRYGRPSALLMVDLNKFKQINDQLGHAVGDAVLKHVSDLLLKHTRETDVVARLGGDEFCVILTEMNAPEDGDKRARALEKIIYYTPCTTALGAVQVGVSIGSRVFNGTETLAQILGAADESMYARKNANR